MALWQMVFVALVITLVVAALVEFAIRQIEKAPYAWEDENGFHLGHPEDNDD